MRSSRLGDIILRLAALAFGPSLLSPGCASPRQKAWTLYGQAQEHIMHAEWKEGEATLRAALALEAIPGANGDLALVLLQDGRTLEALELLDAEERFFPESHHLVEFVRKRVRPRSPL